jgi:hypothetical protein
VNLLALLILSYSVLYIIDKCPAQATVGSIAARTTLSHRDGRAAVIYLGRSSLCTYVFLQSIVLYL